MQKVIAGDTGLSDTKEYYRYSFLVGTYQPSKLLCINDRRNEAIQGSIETIYTILLGQPPAKAIRNI